MPRCTLCSRPVGTIDAPLTHCPVRGAVCRDTCGVYLLPADLVREAIAYARWMTYAGVAARAASKSTLGSMIGPDY